MKLKHLIENLTVDCSEKGWEATVIRDIQFDSRLVKEGDLFVAVKGHSSDGHLYISTAVAKGAVAIVCETMPADPSPNIPYLMVKDARLTLALLACNFYGNPGEQLNLVGVTGTNGKTTVATLLHELFTKCGFKSGLLSTVKNLIGGEVVLATHTTPDPLQLNRLLRKMVDSGCTWCFMEVSSHAIDQERITGLPFKVGIFTNLTHDHLDYHLTFENYLLAKKKFFDGLSSDAIAITNNDDKYGMKMLADTKAKKLCYGLTMAADFHGKILETGFTGMLLQIERKELWTRLLGKFNAYNLLAIYTAATACGIPQEEALRQISLLEAPQGRFQYFRTSNNITGIIDYAHTPDALENILKTIKEVREGNEQLITVVGCGGDRDRTKRPLMAEIAARYSNRLILTSDNPRNEEPEAIIAEMEKGIGIIERKKASSITNRKEAIKIAASLATPGDIILVAGKGHENYQEIKGVKHPFDDYQTLLEMLKMYH